MASILDRYGIKEVADVTFYTIDANGGRKDPVLYLDTLKVSTIEQTAETADARGGKGNPKLITWDYGKDITVTLEDALFSAKSMAIMFGNGHTSVTSGKIVRTVVVKMDGANLPDYFVADVYDTTKKTTLRKKVYFASDASMTTDDVLLENSGLNVIQVTSDDGTKKETISGNAVKAPQGIAADSKVFITYEAMANKKEIVISADTFPGTYYVTGDTYARSDIDGSDQFFQFIIPKAKVTSENTITLEAEGDPSVFNMNLTVLRPENGEMMKLVQYDLTGAAVTTTATE